MSDKDIYKILGYNIKIFRIKQNITQEKLAEKTNLSVRYLSDLENGKVNVTLSTILLIAEIFNIEPYLLLKKNFTNTKITKVYKNFK